METQSLPFLLTNTSGSCGLCQCVLCLETVIVFLCFINVRANSFRLARTAIRWIHKSLGRIDDDNVEFTSLNYSDDIGGCEFSFVRATALHRSTHRDNYFLELGLEETVSKAYPPSTQMPYLGVQFDSVALTMSVPGEKVEELQAELAKWSKKRKTNKRMLQSL